jgi:AcrR family transcriptional regulator
MPSNRAKSPRRKPKQARAHDTVEVILEAAARVLSRYGYASATTNRIADVAGVGVGTVYEYFANKDTVFEALIRREIDALVTVFAEQGAAEDIDLEAALGRLITAGMGAMRHGPELIRALESVPGAAFRQQLAGARQVVIDQIQRLLEAHRQELGVEDLDLAAFIVVCAVEGVGANASSRDFDGRLARELTALATRYLTGSTEPSRSSG